VSIRWTTGATTGSDAAARSAGAPISDRRELIAPYYERSE